MDERGTSPTAGTFDLKRGDSAATHASASMSVGEAGVKKPLAVRVVAADATLGSVEGTPRSAATDGAWAWLV